MEGSAVVPYPRNTDGLYSISAPEPKVTTPHTTDSSPWEKSQVTVGVARKAAVRILRARYHCETSSWVP